MQIEDVRRHEWKKEKMDPVWEKKITSFFISKAPSEASEAMRVLSGGLF